MKIIIISIIILFSLNSVLYGSQATNYDLKQDKKISKNKDRILKEIDNRKKADRKLRNKININRDNIEQNAKDIRSLEKTKYIVETGIRLFDTKKWEGEIHNSYDVRMDRDFAITIKFTYKLGTSFEEREIDKLKRELEQLRRLVE